jgi:hypothetical protein
MVVRHISSHPRRPGSEGRMICHKKLNA